MRKAMIVGMALLAAMNARGGRAPEKTQYQLDLYLQDGSGVDPSLLHRARLMTIRMFEEIGVRVRWQVGEPRPALGPAATCGSPQSHKEVVVRMVSREPQDSYRGALGYSAPYAQSGVRVTIFYDRVLRMSKVGSNGLGPALLAHVLAHEIAHVLQGIARHSEEGMMKAQWTVDDQSQMQIKPLPFTPFDAELIHFALDRGSCGTQMATLAGSAATSASATR